ncbi:MAG TPA: hypothetical protein VGD90_11170 [Sphingobacteriaceae bacterium]
MKKHILRSALAILLSTSVFAVYSQTPGGSGDPGMPGDNGDPDGEDVPLDGGVVFLLAAGAAYGYKKLRDNKQVSMD